MKEIRQRKARKKNENDTKLYDNEAEIKIKTHKWMSENHLLLKHKKF